MYSSNKENKACFTAKTLITVYKVFLMPLRDMLFMINLITAFFCKKLKSVQHKAALAISGAIQGTSRETLFQELGLESLKSRRWFRCPCCIFKIIKNEAPNYLISLVPIANKSSRQETNIYQPITAEQIVLSIYFFPVL